MLYLRYFSFCFRTTSRRRWGEIIDSTSLHWDLPRSENAFCFPLRPCRLDKTMSDSFLLRFAFIAINLETNAIFFRDNFCLLTLNDYFRFLLSPGKSIWQLVLEQFDDLLVKILLLAAIISFVSIFFGEELDKK